MAAAVVGAGMGPGSPRALEYTAQVAAFRTSAGEHNFDALNEQIKDDAFLRHLAKHEMEALVDSLHIAVREPMHLDYVQTVVSTCHGELALVKESRLHRLRMNDDLVPIFDCLNDFRNYEHLESEELSGIVSTMAWKKYWPVVETLFTEKLDKLNPPCLRQIAANLPLEHPRWAEMIGKIIPRIVPDNCQQTSRCLFNIAEKSYESGHMDCARSILDSWDQMTPFPIYPTTGDCAKMIIELAPGRIAECLMSTAQVGRCITADSFVRYGALDLLSGAELGPVLAMIATSGKEKCDNYQWYSYNQDVVAAILKAKDGDNISPFYLRQALFSLTIWLRENPSKGDDYLARQVEKARAPTIAACERLKQMIAAKNQ